MEGKRYDEWIPISEMDYESPISVYTERMAQDVITNQEELVMKEVLRRGVTVNKEELEKALKYDRDQYEKGYRDGIMASRWIPTTERMPEVGETVLASVDGFKRPCILWVGKFAWISVEVTALSDDITAWMPLPEPY